jgi:hypothetical protein
MSQENLGSKAFVAGTDLEAYRRVKLSSGNVVYADAGEEFIGVTARKALSGEFVAINLRSASRTYKMVANGAITAGVAIYGALGGKVSASASGVTQGVALEAATADGDIIECFQNNGVAGAIDGASTAIGDPTINGSVPVVFAKQGITDATTTPIICPSRGYMSGYLGLAASRYNFPCFLRKYLIV